MSTPPIPPAGNNPLPSVTEQMELLKFLREESVASREALHDQAEADRNLLKHILWVVSVPLSIALAAATWFGISSITSLKQSIQDQAKTEGAQAIAKTTADLQKQVHNTVDDQFKTENIRQTLHDAAVEAAKTEASPLIKDAVRAQVGTAVAAHSSQIESIAVKAVNEKVESEVAPLAAQATRSLEELHVQQLISRANSDDARAYDQLLPLSDRNTMVMSVILERHRYALDQVLGLGMFTGCLDPKSADFTSELNSSDIKRRKDAIANCTSWSGQEFADPKVPNKKGPIEIEEEFIPIFVNVALTETSLAVRARAIDSLNQFFSKSPGYPDKGLDLLDSRGLEQWWAEHKTDYRALAWISRMRFRGPGYLNANVDSTYLFDQVMNVKASTSVDREALQNTILQLRAHAEQPNNATIASLKLELHRDTCDSVKSDLAARVHDWKNRKDQPVYVEILDQYGTNELAFLKSCPADPQYLHTIADYASHSASLSKRYGGIVVVNAWMATHFDQFDPKDFLVWWTAHSREYPN